MTAADTANFARRAVFLRPKSAPGSAPIRPPISSIPAGQGTFCVNDAVHRLSARKLEVGTAMKEPVLSQLLDTLGPSPLRLLTPPARTETPVSGVLIYERREPLPAVRDTMLLCVGVRPASVGARRLVRQAANFGYSCLVIKTYGEPVEDLVPVAEEAGLTLLATDEAVPWQHIDATVSSAFAATRQSNRWVSATSVGDLFAFANAVAAMVGGATAIEDPHQRILSYSTLPDQPIDEERRHGILGLQVPYAQVNDPQYHELSQTTKVCRFAANHGPGSMPRLAIAVRAGNELLGSIWVIDANGELGSDAEVALSEAASIAAMHLLAARTATDVARRQRADVLRRLLSDPSSVPAVAPQLGLSADMPVAVAAFMVGFADSDGVLAAHAATRLTDLVSLHCEAQYGRNGCTLIGNTVYALLPSGPNGSSYRDLVADIARRAHRAFRAPVRAGIGSRVAGLHLAANSRQDADLVLRVLADQPCEIGQPLVATIEEVRASATLASLTEILAGNSRLTQGLAHTIRAYDREHKTTYAPTLLAYFSANSDIADASRCLNVHPNTCRYRLARAEEIFGFSLNDPDERLLLWLQLRLADPHSRRAASPAKHDGRFANARDAS